MSKELKASALEHTWNSMGTEGQKFRLDVEEVERGVKERKPYRVAQGLMGMMSSLPHALRLLGRLDQVQEDTELDSESNFVLREGILEGAELERVEQLVAAKAGIKLPAKVPLTGAKKTPDE